MSNIRKDIGERLRAVRKERGLTQEQLGKIIDYSSMAVSHFENGIRELKVSDIKKLCEHLNKEISYFIQPDLTFFRSGPTSQMAEDDQNRKAVMDFDKFLEENKF